MTGATCYFIGGPWDLTKRAVPDKYPPMIYEVAEVNFDRQRTTYGRDRQGRETQEVVAPYTRHQYRLHQLPLDTGGRFETFAYIYQGTV